MTQADWAAQLVRVIAGEIRRYRHEQKMSAQQLADRCRDLGLPVQRSVLANLESGRRPTLSVPELLVMAEALSVPPVLLIAPVPEVSVEILPGRHEDPWDALLWLEGDDGRDVGLVRLHREQVRDWLAQGDRLRMTGPLSSAGLNPYPHPLKLSQVVEDRRRSIEGVIRMIRADMRERGMRPPALPPELARLDDEVRA